MNKLHTTDLPISTAFAPGSELLGNFVKGATDADGQAVRFELPLEAPIPGLEEGRLGAEIRKYYRGLQLSRYLLDGSSPDATRYRLWLSAEFSAGTLFDGAFKLGKLAIHVGYNPPLELVVESSGTVDPEQLAQAAAECRPADFVLLGGEHEDDHLLVGDFGTRAEQAPNTQLAVAALTVMINEATRHGFPALNDAAISSSSLSTTPLLRA